TLNPRDLDLPTARGDRCARARDLDAEVIYPRRRTTRALYGDRAVPAGADCSTWPHLHSQTIGRGPRAAALPGHLHAPAAGRDLRIRPLDAGADIKRSGAHATRPLLRDSAAAACRHLARLVKFYPTATG